MPAVHFQLKPVKEKPKRKPYRTDGSSKYLPIINAFLESEHKLVKVEDTGIEANNLRVQLKRICDQRGLSSVKLTVRNKELYLEKE